MAGKGGLEHYTSKDGGRRTDKKIIADSVGPDLRFVTASIQRTERQAPAPATEAPAASDEEPF